MIAKNAIEKTSTSSAESPGADRIDLDQLKQSADLLALVRSRGFEPKRHGNGKWKIPCPFHADEEASLVITPGKNLWHCFGCDKGGSAIDLVKELDGLTVREAIFKLADESNGAIRCAAELPRASEPAARSPHLQKLLDKAAEFYHKALSRYPEGLAYLRERGITDAALMETFKVGYANETIHDALPPDGDLLENLQAVGLLDRKGREHFRDCVVFPVYDHRGNVTEMYGRKIIERTKVKHLYLPGPHRGVFNYVCARSFNDLLLTESVLDACALWQAGFKNTTCVYGNNGLTEDHLTLFRTNQVQQITLVMDGDDAGRTGAAKIAGKLEAVGIDVAVVELPEGEDAASFLQNESVEAFGELLKEAHRGETAKSNPLLEEARIEPKPNGFQLAMQRRMYDVVLGERKTGKIRATIKAMTADRLRFHVDTVELYQARSRKTFVADAAKLYGADAETVAVDLNRIIEQCETVAADPEPADVPEAIRLTEKERREAERFGRRKNLLDAIGRDVKQCGYVGERENVLTAYLAMTSRKMDEPLAFLVLSESGAGKSALQDAVLNLCPPEDLVKLTSISERALFYKGETSLKHKVLALEEVAGAEDADYAIRNLISAKELVIETTVKDPASGRLTTMENRVQGPTAVFETTTKPDLDPETLSRFLVATIDESRAQTRAILDAQRKARTLEGFKAKLERERIAEKHHRFQRLLKPVRVFNPFADLLTYSDEQLMTRRDQPKYLALIDAIAFLHQFGRAVKTVDAGGKSVEYIEVTLRDITLAHELAEAILGHSLDELRGPSRNLLLLTEEMVRARARKRDHEPHRVEFTRRELREFTKWSDYQVKTHVKQLEELEYLRPVGGRNGQAFRYRLIWTGEGKNGEPFLLGLKPVEQLREEANLAGLETGPEG